MTCFVDLLAVAHEHAARSCSARSNRRPLRIFVADEHAVVPVRNDALDFVEAVEMWLNNPLPRVMVMNSP